MAAERDVVSTVLGFARTLGAVLKYREDTDRVHALARGALFGG